MIGHTDKYKELAELAEKAVKYNVFAKLTRHGRYGIRHANKCVHYKATDGESLIVTEDGNYTSRYGSITPEYLIDYIKQAIKCVNHAKYISGKQRARDKAIEYSNSYVNSLADMLSAQYTFEKLGKRYGLIREFRENAII